MAPKKDPRREVGAVVSSKVSVVTSDAECKRLFGSLWKTTIVTGVVKSVVTPPRGSGKQASLVVDWSVGGMTKTKEVKVVNTKLVEGPTLHSTLSEAPSVDRSTPRDDTGAENQDSDPGQTPCSNGSVAAHQVEMELSGPVGHDGTETHGSCAPTASLLERMPVARVENVTHSQECVTVQGVRWLESDIRIALNGPVPRRYWTVAHVTGYSIAENQGVSGLTPYDYFTWMFPMSHLPTIVTQTNMNLARYSKALTTPDEILRFFGVLVLMTRYEYGDRRNLWKTTSTNKYLAAPNFTRIMPRHRFESLRLCIRFSVCPQSDDDGVNRWSLVDDFVSAINEHREMFVTPSDLICVDESMSRWYGIGGDWIDVGLPTYRAIDRKPENGCEIKTSACGRSGLMLRLEIVKSPAEDTPLDEVPGMNHGTAVALRLVSPWLHTNRIVCADSYFASVQTATALRDNGMRFIGVVKTATRGYPMAYLSAKPMTGRGTWYSMTSRRDASGNNVSAVLWVDRERRYFVATTGTTLPGQTIYRERWRRVGNVSKKTVTETAIPQVAQTYYSAASQIDRHNRCRQDDLDLEKKFQVKEWSLRVNTSLLAVCIVDAWLLYKGNCGGRDRMPPNQFYATLAEQLIDNKYGVTSTRSQIVDHWETDVTASGIGPHLTPSSRKRKREDGTVTGCTYQGRCRVCKNGTKSKYVCSECTRSKFVDYWICHSDTGRGCFAQHLRDSHLQD